MGATAQEARTALIVFIDELQYVDEDEMAALITASHRCAQRKLPVTLVGAGLPQLRGRMGRAKVTSLGPTRNQLIAKCMIRSPSHGDTAFTVPLFDAFMHRIMPGTDWRD